ncbi:MAG: hypothetical protein PHS59_01750 [Paludibacter sp.]|nr:hypothetical protein [Paludibacter sp.]
MKKYAMLLLACTFMFSVAINAQDRENNGGRQGGNTEVRQQVTPEKRAEKLAKDLSLTDAEKAKVVELYKKQDVDMTKFRSEVNRDTPDFRTKMKEFRESQDAELKAIIGDEKFQKMQTQRQEQRQNMQNRGGGANRNN